MAAKFQFRRDTEINWSNNNPVLSQGEVGVTTDTKKFKVGDGATAWTALSWAVNGAQIDDLNVSTASTWSSDKTSSEIQSPPRYDVASATATATLDLALQQVFIIDASVSRTLSLANAPSAGRAMTVVIRFNGSAGLITWFGGIDWDTGTAPSLNTTWTVVTLMWNGTNWSGFKSGGA